MKLIRFGEAGKEKTGLIINDKRYETSAFGEDYDERFFEPDGLNRLADFVEVLGFHTTKFKLSIQKICLAPLILVLELLEFG